jgi:hypothetical protein
MRKRIIIYIALTHYLLSVIAAVTNFSLGMSSFDTGEAAGIWEKILYSTSRVLLFPAFPYYGYLPLPKGMFDGQAGHVLFLANSFFWACMIYCVASWLRSKISGAEHLVRADKSSRPR